MAGQYNASIGRHWQFGIGSSATLAAATIVWEYLALVAPRANAAKK
jgi:hypothetical protein